MQRQNSSRWVFTRGGLGFGLVCAVSLSGCGLFNPCGNGVVDKGEACEGTIEQPCQTTCNTRGKQVCNPKTCQWQNCISIEEEVCNGLDDDCDGATDEDFECALGSTKPCVTSCGTQGTIACNETCQWETSCTPPREICGNGIDDDCNGLTDEFGVIGEKIEIAKGFCGRGKPAIAWTGKDYGIVWNTQCRPTAQAYFMRVSKEGKSLTNLVPLEVGKLPLLAKPSMVWNGHSFNVVFALESTPGHIDHLYFLDLDLIGQPLNKEIVKPTSANSISYFILMARNDNATLAVMSTYHNDRKEGFEFLAVSSEGKRLGRSSSFIGDRPIMLADVRSVSWSENSFGFVWQESADKVYFNKIAGFPEQLSVSPKSHLPVHGTHFNLAWSGQNFGVVWSSAEADKTAPPQEDARRAFDEIYFALLSETGQIELGPLQITRAKGYASLPSIVWTGKEFGLAWIDGRDGGAKRFHQQVDFENDVPIPLPFREVYFTRISLKGKPIGDELRVTRSNGHSYDAVLDHSDNEYGMFWIDFSEKYRYVFTGELKGSLYFQRLGCQ